MTLIALVGCSKTKRFLRHNQWEAAWNVYDSDLFQKRMAYVESRKLPWYIISARSGLTKPDTPIRTYDETLSVMTEIAIAEWHIGVANRLMFELWYEFNAPKLKTVTVEIHAGKKYSEPLASILKMFGIKVVKPVANMGIGEQLAYYKSSTQPA